MRADIECVAGQSAGPVPARSPCPTYHPPAIAITHQATSPLTPASQTYSNAAAFIARSGKSHTSLIASLPRGSAQSGFNEAAIAAQRYILYRDLTEASRFKLFSIGSHNEP